MIANKLNTFYFLLIFGILLSCNNLPDYADEPTIEFVSINKSSISQDFLNTDSIIVTLSFTDGDGDIGNYAQDTAQNLFVIDNRTGFKYGNFKFAAIPEAGANNGVSGDIQFKLYTTCCIFPDLIPPCSTDDLYPSNNISFNIYIIDRSKNQSNTITTDELVLLCD